MRKSFLALVFLAICPLLVAQQALNNDSVIKLVKAGLSDDLIVSTINASPGTYDTSADGLIALKSAGASDKVVAAIVQKAAAPVPAAAVPVAPPAPVSTDPDDPAAPHQAGIYIFSDSSPAGSKMTALKPSFYTEKIASGGSLSMMTYGIAKVKNKDVVSGAHANLRITDSQPTFYFYFEDANTILNHHSSLTFDPSMGSTRNPIEFVLRKFDIKKDTREIVLFSRNSYSGPGATPDNGLTGFTYNNLRPGVYKVTLNAPLSPGEYGFLASDGLNKSVFDFGKD
jgi:hypothetical protein